MNTIKLKITGESPILLSCDKLADPLDPETIEYKKLTSIRGKAKTFDIIKEIAQRQYEAGVYFNDEAGIHMPTINIKKCLEEGAKLSRDGDKVRKGVMIFDDYSPLQYPDRETITTPTQLWESGKYLDKRGVVISNKKVICYRPKFSEWSLEVEVYYDAEIIEGNQIVDFLNSAGKYIGLGGFRPAKSGMFGRFTVEELV